MQNLKNPSRCTTLLKAYYKSIEDLTIFKETTFPVDTPVLIECLWYTGPAWVRSTQRTMEDEIIYNDPDLVNVRLPSGSPAVFNLEYVSPIQTTSPE
jgi:hypothetical protein